MLSLYSNLRYFLYVQSTDLRKGFDGLSGLVSQRFNQSPLSGDIFIFINKSRNRIKLLQWQRDGFAIYYKRLEKGTYEFPAKKSNLLTTQLTSQQLMLILEGISLQSVKKRRRYQLSAVDK
jgi:transposase